MEFLHMHECPWTGSERLLSALIGDIHTYKFALEHGCPAGEFDQSSVWTMICTAIESYRYAHENMCTTSTYVSCNIVDCCLDTECPCDGWSRRHYLAKFR